MSTGATSSILLPATPGRSKMATSLHSLSSFSAFEDVKNVCAKFTTRFDAWVARARQARLKKDFDFKSALQSESFYFVFGKIGEWICLIK
jgi:hypothetical protein